VWGHTLGRSTHLLKEPAIEDSFTYCLFLLLGHSARVTSSSSLPVMGLSGIKLGKAQAKQHRPEAVFSI
jgi:hypothetical protein